MKDVSKIIGRQWCFFITSDENTAGDPAKFTSQLFLCR